MARCSLVVAGVFLLALAGCGRNRPSAPAAVSTPVPAPTVFSVTAGDTGRPLAGATFTLAGTAYTSDAAGQVRVDGALIGAWVDVAASGMLDRQTRYRSPSSTRFALWPRRHESGIDENYTATLVYTWAGEDPGADPMLRLRANAALVAIVLSPELLGDGASMEAHERGVDSINAAIGGTVRYALAPGPTEGVTSFEARVDPSEPRCGERTRAFVRWQLRSNEIVGGSIVYCSAQVARSATVTHELGHTFGLQHSPDPRDVMFPTFERRRDAEFDEKQSLIMRLMLQRPAGNRYPDNDRDVQGLGQSGVFEVVCPS